MPSELSDQKRGNAIIEEFQQKKYRKLFLNKQEKPVNMTMEWDPTVKLFRGLVTCQIVKQETTEEKNNSVKLLRHCEMAPVWMILSNKQRKRLEKKVDQEKEEERGSQLASLQELHYSSILGLESLSSVQTKGKKTEETAVE